MASVPSPPDTIFDLSCDEQSVLACRTNQFVRKLKKYSSQVQIGNFNGLRNLDNSNSLARVVHGLTKTPWVAPAPRS